MGKTVAKKAKTTAPRGSKEIKDLERTPRPIARNPAKWRFNQGIWDVVMLKVAGGMVTRKALTSTPGAPSRPQFWAVLRDRPELRAQYDQAKEDWAEANMDALIELTDSLEDAPVLDPAQVAYLKLRIQTRQWVAARLLPRRWGDRVQQDVTLTVDYANVIQQRLERLKRE